MNFFYGKFSFFKMYQILINIIFIIILQINYEFFSSWKINIYYIHCILGIFKLSQILINRFFFRIYIWYEWIFSRNYKFQKLSIFSFPEGYILYYYYLHIITIGYFLYYYFQLNVIFLAYSYIIITIFNNFKYIFLEYKIFGWCKISEDGISFMEYILHSFKMLALFMLTKTHKKYHSYFLFYILFPLKFTFFSNFFLYLLLYLFIIIVIILYIKQL